MTNEEILYRLRYLRKVHVFLPDTDKALDIVIKELEQKGEKDDQRRND